MSAISLGFAKRPMGVRAFHSSDHASPPELPVDMSVWMYPGDRMLTRIPLGAHSPAKLFPSLCVRGGKSASHFNSDNGQCSHGQCRLGAVVCNLLQYPVSLSLPQQRSPPRPTWFWGKLSTRHHRVSIIREVSSHHTHRQAPTSTRRREQSCSSSRLTASGTRCGRLATASQRASPVRGNAVRLPARAV